MVHISWEKRLAVWQGVPNILKKNYYFHLQRRRGHEEGGIKFLKTFGNLSKKVHWKTPKTNVH
jgi:hypothetical protein